MLQPCQITPTLSQIYIYNQVELIWECHLKGSEIRITMMVLCVLCVGFFFSQKGKVLFTHCRQTIRFKHWLCQANTNTSCQNLKQGCQMYCNSSQTTQMLDL